MDLFGEGNETVCHFTTHILKIDNYSLDTVRRKQANRYRSYSHRIVLHRTLHCTGSNLEVALFYNNL